MYKHKEDRNKYMREYRKRKPLTQKQKKSYSKRKRNLLRNKRQKLVDMFGGECSICGYKKCIWALDFHHKDKKIKEKSVSKNNDFNKMVKEAKKCILVCTNCHREIHSNEV